METKEGNRIIAEFMGLKKHRQHDWYMIPKDYSPVLTNNWSHPNFDIDWNFLMPVVEKIKKCGYDDDGFKLLQQIDHWLVMVDIKETLQACINFINWYNTAQPNLTTKP